MRTVIVIPARFASSRLPGKPLLRSTGKYLVQHVYEQARAARKASAVVVATDDRRIVAAVEGFGGDVVMTRADHPSGTDRVAEAAGKLDADLVVNLQGDEPLVEPASLDLLVGLLESHADAQMATLAVPVESADVYRSPHCVKVACDRLGRALYFSRSPIPAVRDGDVDFAVRPSPFLHHLGLYAYRRDALLRLAALPPDPLEELEQLEQLRALGLGWKIQVGVMAHAGRGVDTLEDYNHFVRTYRRARHRLAA